ncbi:MAG: hypothetical protein WDW36_009035 [Sanguina aurantia]
MQQVGEHTAGAPSSACVLPPRAADESGPCRAGAAVRHTHTHTYTHLGAVPGPNQRQSPVSRHSKQSGGERHGCAREGAWAVEAMQDAATGRRRVSPHRGGRLDPLSPAAWAGSRGPAAAAAQRLWQPSREDTPRRGTETCTAVRHSMALTDPALEQQVSP